ncbi:selenocysteine-specific translation elongation factor [Brevibacterium luteolum]|uniref:selenocysteine-specific translation elongation factor n=1 Tax=Brevibacterium luteolum TaxID=199591 RepID=UPI0021AF10D1|nr:selenocysteine-specific translation elongation factor [Brevibacterium luteolum]MCT1874264.1 selenocysteine-specific translation elongation factor [Brevibacterium luteolum]MCT1891477.1 selenocysteine-specific translation elongation factor [Brevibacterium luteolum]MCT1894138.1 selenocysteine-specific translation elongation factor [Brevibacterium luteolum]MCT1924969.1 selenocysteine-specific translation elongation factor [Brevibacterium luteolum]
MSGFVIATAGHVDHGKSTLVRALTGIEPDRWAEERERGLTIDLGFAWTTLPSGRQVAFVDVPGHERYVGNMLAGLGPVPVVCFVIAADEGWQAQSSEHRDAIAALGITAGLIVITRRDRAPDAVPEVTARARAELRGTGLAAAPIVACSGVTGEGLDEVRGALDGVLAGLPEPDPHTRLRLWIDRAFTIAGSGTVVTGTLAGGTVRAGERLQLLGQETGGLREITVRGVQSRGEPSEVLEPVSRAALNLRGIPAAEVHRGDALISADWWITDTVDVRWASGGAFDEGSEHITVHIGTAAVGARLRPFDADHARLQLSQPLPLQLGDRMVLRDSGAKMVVAGVQVLDLDPPTLTRRGAGRRRAEALAELPAGGSLAAEVARRQAVEAETLTRFGLDVSRLPEGVVTVGRWLVDVDALRRWAQTLRTAVTAHQAVDALTPGMTRQAAVHALELPHPDLLDAVVQVAKLNQRDGIISPPQPRADLGRAEKGIQALERQLKATPFAAPEADDLSRLGLGARELAAAERVGRLIRIADGVVLLPSAPAQAMRVLAGLGQPFTASQARQALGTTRRVAIPLLEHLDSRGWTRRLDGNLREVVR